MREIEFRGKRLRDGEWVTGHGFCIDNALTFLSVDVYSDSKFDFYEIDPETVGQYTGLKDRNGVKIFEGDIVRFADVDGDVWMEDEPQDQTYKVFGDDRRLVHQFGDVYRAHGDLPAHISLRDFVASLGIGEYLAA